MMHAVFYTHQTSGACAAECRSSCTHQMEKNAPSKILFFLSPRYFDRVHDFSVNIPICCKDVYANNLFSRTASLLNSLPLEHFPLTYGLIGFMCLINRYISSIGSFLSTFLYAFNIFFFFFYQLPAMHIQPRALHGVKSQIIHTYIHTHIYIYILYIYMYVCIHIYIYNI